MMKRIISLLFVTLFLSSCFQEKELIDGLLNDKNKIEERNVLLKRVKEQRFPGIRQSSKYFLLLNSIQVDDGIIVLNITKDDAISLGVDGEEYDRVIEIINKANKP